MEGVGCSPGAQQQTPQYGPCELEVLRPRMLKSVAAIPPAEIEETIREVRALLISLAPALLSFVRCCAPCSTQRRRGEDTGGQRRGEVRILPDAGAVQS